VRLDGRAELLAELANGNRPIDPQASSEELRFEDALRLKRPEEYIEAYREILWKAVSDRLPEGSARIGKTPVVVVGCGAPAVPFDSEIRPW